MEGLNNPFIVYGYKGPQYFCDREEETEKMIKALHNERNITLVAPRRMGKTGLIQHVFNHINEREPDTKCFYIDIFATKNLSQLVQLLAQVIIGKLDTPSQSALRRVQEFFSSWRPTVSFDVLTGLPSVSLDIKPGESKESLKQIFEYMKQSGKRCYVAIDEFQQILSYPETGVEALIRSYIQFLPNVYFIFSGSLQHIMEEMFLSARRPFFQSSQMLSLGSIDPSRYREFANSFFASQHREIDDSTFAYIYNKTSGVTWYIQSILSRLFECGDRDLNRQLVDECVTELINEQETAYQNYCSWLTANQLQLLLAIAHEDCVESPLSSKFIHQYRLPATSSVKTALKSLTDKQLVYRKPEGYSVYDIFFGIWLKRMKT